MLGRDGRQPSPGRTCSLWYLSLTFVDPQLDAVGFNGRCAVLSTALHSGVAEMFIVLEQSRPRHSSDQLIQQRSFSLLQLRKELLDVPLRELPAETAPVGFDHGLVLPQVG